MTTLKEAELQNSYHVDIVFRVRCSGNFNKRTADYGSLTTCPSKGTKSPRWGRFNPPIAFMAACEVYKLNIRKNAIFSVT